MFYSSFVCISAYANVSFKTIMRECLRAGLPLGIPSTAPPPVIVPALLGTQAVWIPNQTKKNPCKEGYRDNVAVVGLFEEEEEGTGIASDVVKVEGEDPATPGCLRSVDTRKPRDRNGSP